MARFPAYLRSRVARRFLLLIATLVLVPVALSGAFTYWSISQQAQATADRHLREAAKSFALEFVGRTQLALTLLPEPEWPAGSLRATSGAVTGPVLVRPRLIAEGSADAAALPAVIPQAAWGGGPGAAQLVFAKMARGLPLVYLVKPVTDPAGRRHAIVAELSSEFLWADGDVLPFGYDYCVLAKGNLLVFCSQQALGDQLLTFRQLTADGIPELFRFSVGQDAMLAATWILPATAELGDLHLTFGVSGSEQILLVPAIVFRGTMAPTLALTLLVAIWIALVLVRRRMRPLDELVEATDRLAGGDFSSRVVVSSDDEFAGVGRAFNSMQGILGRQFAELAALSKLDRLILERGSLGAIAEEMVGGIASLQPDGMAAIALRDPDAGSRSVTCWTDGGPVQVLRGAFDQHLLNLLDSPTAPLVREVAPATLAGLGLTIPSPRPVHLQAIRDGQLIVGLVAVLVADDDAAKEPQRHLVRQFADRLSVAAASIRQRERLYALGHIDDLTGLPNRQLFKERLGQALSRAVSDHRSGHMLYIDLDRFKQVNDAEGHATGDRLICAAAERISACVRSIDTVARLAGDEFTVLIPEGLEWQEVEEIGNRIVSALQQPFRLRTMEYYISGSVGVARFPEDGSTLEEIIRNADLAMYSAKELGGSRVVRYQQGMQVFAQERVELEAALRHGIENREFCLVYQPQIEVGTGRVSGVEALIRWQRPGVGLVSPNLFVPMAEQTGLIRELGAFVLEEACRDFVAWRGAGLDLDTVSVNVSLRELKDPGFEAGVARILAKTRMPRDCLKLEITESVLAEDVARASARFRSIQSLGVGIAIDDFGTGYSSLAYLRDFPVDTLKIDRAFIQDVPDDAAAANLLQSIVSMARMIGKKTVAEGIETAGQASFLEQCGCDLLQGFLFAKPLPKDEFLAYAMASGRAARRDVA